MGSHDHFDFVAPTSLTVSQCSNGFASLASDHKLSPLCGFNSFKWQC